MDGFELPILGMASLVLVYATMGLLAANPDRVRKRGISIWVGLNSRTFRLSEENWVRGHELAWPWVKAAFWLTLVGWIVTVGLLIAGLEDESFMLAVLLLAVLVFPTMCGIASASKTLKEEAEEESDEQPLRN